jgi:hypothetical protein
VRPRHFRPEPRPSNSSSNRDHPSQEIIDDIWAFIRAQYPRADSPTAGVRDLLPDDKEERAATHASETKKRIVSYASIPFNFQVHIYV